MTIHSVRLLPIGAMVLLAAGWCRPIEACNVPVFRYAMERWPADFYEVYILHDGKLSDRDRAAVKLLEKAAEPTGPVASEGESSDGEDSGGGPPGSANLIVRVIDIGKETPDGVAKLAAETKSAALPRLVLRHPPGVSPLPAVWIGALTEDNVRRIVDSPVRREIAKRLLGGDSAVWVFLESGDGEKDKASLKILEETLREMEKVLEIPDIGPGDLLEAGMTEDEKDGIKVSFSTLRMSRKDRAESVFLSMLLNSEPDLETPEGEETPPMAFPIFGRGRVLWALLGAGINENTIADSCAFLVGPCSCQVKARNPGIDLVMSVDWDALVMTDTVDWTPLPELAGFESFIEKAAPPGEPEEAAEPEGAKAAEPAASVASEARSLEEPARSAQEKEAPAEGEEGPAVAPPAPETTTEESAESPGDPRKGGSRSLVWNSLIALAVGLAVIAALAVFLRPRSMPESG